MPQKPTYQELETHCCKIEKDLEHYKAEREKLLESEEKFRTITSNAHDAIIMATVDGNISYCNRALESLLGYTNEELMGAKVNSILVNAHIERVFTDTVLLNGQRLNPGVIQEMNACKKDGSEIQIELSNSIVSIKGKKHALGIIRDISERKRVANQLQQSQKMEAIGTLASGIAHDFNNILGAIFGYSHLAQVKSSDNPTVVAYLEEILNASYRAKKLIQHILTFSRQNRPERKVVEIHPLVTEVVGLLRASIPSTINIEYTNSENSLTVTADPTQLHQILMNLVTNAYHSIGDSNGMIRITTGEVDINAVWGGIDLDLPFGRYLQLTVEDTGSGIEPAFIDRIFEPYFTTKEVDVGTGMGLATVHGIVKDHNGAITVDSHPETGSTFHVFLPMEKMELPENMLAPENIPTGEEWILLVDDEEMLAETGMLMLEELGYLVVSETSPVAALELIRSDPSKFDLLITDLTMPVMTGEELAREVIRIRPDMPILLCSGLSKSLSDSTLSKMGFDCLLNKPIIFKDLAKTVRATLDGKK